MQEMSVALCAILTRKWRSRIYDDHVVGWWSGTDANIGTNLEA